MSEHSTFSSVLTSRERTAVPAKSLSFVEGVSMIVGTNIGAGVLSIAYASSKAGFLPLLFWLVVVGSLTTVTMLYVAESTLRTRKHLQLSGLSHRYVGRFGALMMFLSVFLIAFKILLSPSEVMLSSLTPNNKRLARSSLISS